MLAMFGDLYLSAIITGFGIVAIPLAALVCGYALLDG
jgi:hypothetical protein